MSRVSMKNRIAVKRARAKVKKTIASLKGDRNNFRDTLVEWSEKPEVRMVAVGIGVALVTRLALSLSSKYPQISSFLRENLHVIEDKLEEYRGSHSVGDAGSSEARH